MRQVVLDTETTGLDWQNGHRVIEIGCVELVNRRKTDRSFHSYVRPDREIDEAAEEVHGISTEMLADKPTFNEIMDDFLDFVGDAELVIHNAEFDVGFLNNELGLAGHMRSRLQDQCNVLDTLMLARQMHPGQRNSLDALCKRYSIDNSRRDLHGALLDAKLLADVYLAMTGGQVTMSLGESSGSQARDSESEANRVDRADLRFKIARATEQDIVNHETQLDLLDDASADGAVWRKLDS